ncbi:MAG: beta-galactosidase [Lachnospiraceae bacterium]|nr:beta-galactosidase [Lachnospiraceae bacterium]
MADGLKIGVDYYPEHWDKSLWKNDVKLMKEAGVNIVRMAEFAWSRLEPAEGEYSFGWLDEIIYLFAEAGIEVFLCTPTSTPPQWLFAKYPEIIQVDKNQNRIPIGIRGHRCLNSPVYRRLSEEIITKMVERYKDNKCVTGYQIDNELEANHCFCPVCEEKFRNWIIGKYGTTDELNKAYGNNVWSGEFSSFSQVKPPYGGHQQWLNPSHTLDYSRFASDSTIDYVKFQCGLIKSIDSHALVTTNCWLCENMPDFYKLFEKLDFVSYDNYPALKLPEDKETIYSHSFHLDLMRGIKKKNFWIMEQLSRATGGWMPMSQTTRPGMVKGYAMQAVAHGADAVLHFRWRSAVSGAEMFWHGIIDHSNVPGRRFEEFKQLCADIAKYSNIAGSQVKNRVALLYSSEHEYALKLQPQTEGMHYFGQLKLLHDAFASIGLGVDIISEKEDLSKYKIIAAPTLFITNNEVAGNLYKAARNGATVIITNRSGVKDEYNKCIMQQLPTLYSELAGVYVTEYDSIGSRKLKLDIINEEWHGKYNRQDNPYPYCTQWCDLLECTSAVSLATYGEDFYKGTAAVTHNYYGEGNVYYIGTVMDRQSYISLAKVIADKTGIQYIDGLPSGIEITYRYGTDGRKMWKFIFNNTTSKKEIFIDGKNMEIGAFGMEIVEIEINMSKEVME